MITFRRIIATVVVALGAGVLGACSDDDADRTAAGVAVRDVAGAVEVRRVGDARWSPTGETTIHPGDRLRVRDRDDERGRAVLRLAGDGSLELRAGSVVALSELPILRGDGLVIAGDAPLSVGTIGAVFKIASGSTAKLRADLALGAGSYKGSVTVASAGRSMTVPRFRQIDLAAPGLLPSAPAPFAMNAADEWDRRFLGDAIDLGRDLDQRSAGFTAQSRGAVTADAAEFRRILPGLAGEAAFDDRLLRSGPPAAGERLVGATIALHGDEGRFTDRWHEAMAFRGEGADWGLVALDQGVTAEPVLDDLEVAFGRFGDRLEIASRPITTTPRPTAVPVEEPESSATSAPPNGTPPPSNPTPPPTTTPPPESPVQLPTIDTGVEVVDGILDPLVDSVNSVLDGLVGGLLGTPPPPPSLRLGK
jgi:hypothetical protein